MVNKSKLNAWKEILIDHFMKLEEYDVVVWTLACGEQIKIRPITNKLSASDYIISLYETTGKFMVQTKNKDEFITHLNFLTGEDIKNKREITESKMKITSSPSNMKIKSRVMK